MSVLLGHQGVNIYVTTQPEVSIANVVMVINFCQTESLVKVFNII